MSTFSSQRLTLRFVLALLVALPVLALGTVLQPAAAFAGPTGLAPTGAASSAAPVFSWDPVAGATAYDVEVYDGASKIASVTNTENFQWVPASVQLPTGKVLTWQVRAAVGGVESDWSQTTFTRAAISAPSLIGPINGQVLQQPGDPLIYDWTAVPGASSYTVEVGPDPAFVDPALVDTYTTSATRLAPNVIPDDGTYYWRVTANLSSGVKSARSANGDYEVQAVIRSGGAVPPTALPVYPSNDQTIDDVVLDWNPIDGAASYKLQVSTDSNFLTKVVDATGLKSTRFSPLTTLDNDQYWWRIAPVNADGFQTPWENSPVWRFTRRWPNQATLIYPADASTVGDPFYYQWSPITLASSYRLEVSVNPSFTPANSVDTCTTVHTTYTPSTSSGDCWPADSGTYYWRVIGLDGTSDVISEAVNAPVHSFTYDQAQVTVLSPSNGAHVTIPILSWQPYPNASEYKVSVTPTAGGSPVVRNTVTTTLAWPSKLTVDATYRWMVQPVFDDGRTGAALVPGSQRTFVVDAMPDPADSSPEPVSAGAPAHLPPLLTWTSVIGATNYKVRVRVNGSLGGWTYLTGTFAYPAGSDTAGTRLTPGTYEWMVEAYNGGTFLSESLASSTYTILPFDAVTGYRAALTGNASGSGATSCTATLPTACQNLRQTPLLRWDPVAGAATYKLTISNDVNLTNPVMVVTVRGTNIWMNEDALPDANAGSAYFWDVLPCGESGVCATQGPATHQFNKQGLAPVLTSPANGSTQANDIAFSWQDYLATLQADSGAGSSLSTPAETEARSYRIQVADTADFTNVLDTKVVDQRTYTPYDKTYPEQTLYWRVQAIDGTGNNLPWSATRTVIKSSPGPVLTDGIGGETFPGSISLGWNPLAYAKSYNVQVFPSSVVDMDLTTPLMQASGLKQNSWTPTAPLPVGSYKWRVRRADADSRFGQWSSTGTFSSAGSAPTLISPNNGVEVPPRSALFTWQPSSASAPVASYRIQLTRAEGSSPSAVNTVATAYTPTGRLLDGNWTWTVTALDTEGTSLGQASRAFVVAGSLTPTSAVTITGSGKIGTTLTTQPVTWNQPGTATTYQWYRGSSAITGQTASTYQVVPADAGKGIKVRVFGQKAGYDGSTGSDSNVINGVAGDALIVINNPSFTGTRSVGQVLTANHGTWATVDAPGVPAAATYKYQWLRNGASISGATGSTYRLVAADAARGISVRVTATATGYAPGTATSAAGTIAKISSKTAVRLKATTIKRGKHGTLYVTVTAALPRTGTIRIYDGTRLIKSVTLSASNGGKKTVVLPLLRVGRHSIGARYLGNGQINASSSPRIVLKVVR